MKYALRRILVTVPLLLAVSLVVFALTDALPGDAADMRFEKHPALKEEWREKRGLNDPFVVRWGRYVWGVVTDFDLDRSYLDDEPVGHELSIKLQATFELTVCALILAVLVGMTKPTVSDVFRDVFPSM